MAWCVVCVSCVDLSQCCVYVDVDVVVVWLRVGMCVGLWCVLFGWLDVGVFVWLRVIVSVLCC